MKRLMNTLFIALMMVLSSLTYAKSGLLFNIAQSGASASVDIILCLNGKGPLSCQNYHVTAQDLAITSTVNHQYFAAGIKVLTPGYPPTGCTFYPKTGYCLFGLSKSVPTIIHLGSSSPTNAALSLNPTTLSFVTGTTSSTVTLTNTSYSVTANGLILTPSANLSFVSNNCATSLAPQASCQFTVTSSSVSTGDTVVISANNANTATLPVTVTAAPQTTINISPSPLNLIQGGAGQTVTITNSGSADAYGINVTGAPSLGVIVSGSCVSPLSFVAPNNTCQLTVTPGGTMGNTSVTIAGSNTNTVTESIVIAAAASTTLTVSVTGIIPVTSDGSSSGTITVTNNGTNTAYSVQAILPPAWTEAAQDFSDCTTIPPVSSAPNNTCTLSFTSTTPYVAQGSIVVTGDNISSPPTTALAFSMAAPGSGASGLVFYVNTTSGVVKTAQMTDISGGVLWQTGAVATSAMNNNDGCANTQSIVTNIGSNSAASLCATNPPANCTLSSSGDVTGWYMPAICEMGYGLISGPGSCATDNQNNDLQSLYNLGFGAFTAPPGTYWSSTEVNPGFNAWAQSFSASLQLSLSYVGFGPSGLRCVQAFIP